MTHKEEIRSCDHHKQGFGVATLAHQIRQRCLHPNTRGRKMKVCSFNLIYQLCLYEPLSLRLLLKGAAMESWTPYILT